MSIFISSKTFMVEARAERSRMERERGDSYLVFTLSLGCSVPASLLQQTIFGFIFFFFNVKRVPAKSNKKSTKKAH